MDKCHRFTIIQGIHGSSWFRIFFTSWFLLHFLFQLPWGGQANHRLHPGLRLAALGCAWLRLAALGCAWRCRCGGQRSTRRECGRVGILAQQRARLYIETKSIHQVSTSLNFSSSRKSRKSSYLEITMVDNLQMSKAHKKQSTVGSWSSENGVKSSCDSRKILCN